MSAPGTIIKPAATTQRTMVSPRQIYPTPRGRKLTRLSSALVFRTPTPPRILLQRKRARQASKLSATLNC